MQTFASLRTTLATLLFFSIASSAHAESSKSDKSCPKHAFKGKPRVVPLVNIASISQLPPNLDCLDLNDPESDLTGYTWYQSISYDSTIAVNPKNPKNMIIVAQQDALTNATDNSDLPIAIVAFYTLDGGESWNKSDLVLSRCVGATLYQANNNFIAAYFPSVSFDSDGNGYVLSSSFNLFTADQQPTTNENEGNIVAKTTDGGASWNYITKAFRDDGICHFLDYPSITADPYRDNTVYIVSADTTCEVNAEDCTDPNFNGNNNITFQRSTDGGASWTDPSLIASFPTDPTTCIPIPYFNQLIVLPDDTKTLLASSYIQENEPDTVFGANLDRLLVWSSKDDGNTWNMYTVADNIQHVLPFDPATSSPPLPFTEFTSKDMVVSQCNGDIYVVYSDPQFNPNGEAGCVIKRSKNGGRTWSKPQPVNPNSLGSQTFLPAVAVAKDGTVGVLFYDFRNFNPGDPILSTDVWVSFFSKDLKHYKGEVRLTPNSFDSRKTFRGYNGIDIQNCIFDYYISDLVGIKATGNDFVATFTVTNDACPPVDVGTTTCDAFPLVTDDCNRQNIAFARVNRH